MIKFNCETKKKLSNYFHIKYKIVLTKNDIDIIEIITDQNNITEKKSTIIDKNKFTKDEIDDYQEAGL